MKGCERTGANRRKQAPACSSLMSPGPPSFEPEWKKCLCSFLSQSLVEALLCSVKLALGSVTLPHITGSTLWVLGAYQGDFLVGRKLSLMVVSNVGVSPCVTEHWGNKAQTAPGLAARVGLEVVACWGVSPQ